VAATGIAHFDDAAVLERRLGHLDARWTLLGEAAGSVTVGVRRIEVAAGGWSTPVHDHGGAEEIFYVLGGRGLSWRDGVTAEIGTGDCIVYLAGGGAHSLHALEPLDVLAFGPRPRDTSTRFPRLGLSMIGSRLAQSVPQPRDGAPVHFARELELGPPALPAAPGPRDRIVNVAEVEPQTIERPRVARTRRNLGRAAGSVATGLQHVEVTPGRMSAPAHCHSLEEEIFVILDGDGTLLLDGAPTPVHGGHVVSRPPGTGVAHTFVAGPGGLRYLAYGTRELGDVCLYPDSQKIAFAGVGVIARIERLDYWDGED
jgi:uncharacterized cupin superfamily protein